MSKKLVQHEVRHDDKDLYLSFATRIVANGFASAEELRDEYGAEAFTKCVASLFRTHRALREVRRPWKDEKDALGYEWADQRYSQAQIKKLPPEVAIVVEKFKKGNAKYTDFERIKVRCRWTNKVLGAIPHTEASGDKLNSFDRANGKGSDVLIPAYCLRAMAAKALPAMLKEAALARRIMFKTIHVPASAISEDTEVRPVLDPDGRTGLGMNRSECLPSGTEFDIEALVPTSALAPDEYLRMLNLAGEFVHLSPARSSGFGDFEVVGEATE